MPKLSKIIIIFIAVYSAIAVGFAGLLNLNSSNAINAARIKMVFGLIFLWCIVCGTLMYRAKDKIKNFVLKINLDWKLKFFLSYILQLQFFNLVNQYF